MTYTAWSVVFGEQPTAAKWNQLGTNDAGFKDGTNFDDSIVQPKHLLTGTGADWVWDSYTPTFNNTTLGNGTVAGRFLQTGKTVIARATFTLGSTSAMGTAPTVSLPVTANTTGMTAGGSPMGISYHLDAGAAFYQGSLYYSTASVALVGTWNSAGTYVVNNGVTATAPFAWGNTDQMMALLMYEAA